MQSDRGIKLLALAPEAIQLSHPTINVARPLMDLRGSRVLLRRTHMRAQQAQPSRTHPVLGRPIHHEEMMTDRNQFQVITLVGHLTADPVLRAIDDNRKVCDMRLAVNDQKDQPPLFIDVATFGSQAEACAKYLGKGRAIAVTGRLIYREWVADDGTRRSKHAVVGRVQFGGRPDAPSAEPETTEPEEVATF